MAVAGASSVPHVAPEYLSLPAFMKGFHRVRCKDDMLDTGFYFSTGWRDFVRATGVGHGDHLTFTLVDVGIFNVKRFDRATHCPPQGDVDGNYPSHQFRYSFGVLYTISFFLLKTTMWKFEGETKRVAIFQYLLFCKFCLFGKVYTQF
ncbi:hypothetical protein SASPL_152703 [Salvia splendens]|uniref:TF-B3 domain-containing protein n=1 Tax=Salvia splendens TaxID=180675 RepID=A0A8X8W4D7_SALSN|nr:hypothetical protein SASPL_152703 [Salvia splendens]